MKDKWLESRDADDYFENLQELRDGYGSEESKEEEMLDLVKPHLYWIVRYRFERQRPIHDSLRIDNLEDAIEHAKALEKNGEQVLGILRVEQTVENELVIKEE